MKLFSTLLLLAGVLVFVIACFSLPFGLAWLFAMALYYVLIKGADAAYDQHEIDRTYETLEARELRAIQGLRDPERRAACEEELRFIREIQAREATPAG
jgi:hypothetical protein